MKTTHNQAIEKAKEGKWQEAWKIAQEDEGLNSEVTFEAWSSFAVKVIVRDYLEEASNAFEAGRIEDAKSLHLKAFSTLQRPGVRVSAETGALLEKEVSDLYVRIFSRPTRNTKGR